MPAKSLAVLASERAVILEDKLPPSLQAAVESPLQRAVRQLLEALIYEKILDCISANKALYKPNTFYFNVQGRNYFCKGRLRAFDRPHLNIASLHLLENSQTHCLKHNEYPALISVLVNSLCENCQQARKLIDEIQQSVHWSQWNKTYRFDKHFHQLDFHNKEHYLNSGHPYHPCFKARSGFTETDYQAYSSECGQVFQLHWLAVHSSRVESTFFSEKDNFYQAEFGEGVYQELCARLRPHEVETFYFFPVHPWQWQNYLKNAFQQEIKEQRVIYLGELGEYYSASQSQRTLLNNTRLKAANIKLPLNIVCTSSLRCLQTHSVLSAPLLSNWLHQRVSTDDFFKTHPLRILREYAGLVYQTNTGNVPSAGDDNQDTHLACLWRESIESQLNPGEQALPFSALYALDHDNHLPLIQTWIMKFGCEAWLNQLFKVLVLPLWHLLVKHGLALEAHAQNSILIVRDGWPLALAMRDFHESLEYVEDFLGEPERCPPFKTLQACYANAKPNQYYWMDSVEALRELFMDTVFVFHLSELALCCEKYFGFAEDKFWKNIANLLDAYRNSQPELLARCDQIQHQREYISVEALLRKKMDKSASEFRHTVRNPFFIPASSDEQQTEQGDQTN